MRSLAETLHDEPDTEPPKRSEYLERIMGEVDRLSSIVSDLLVLSSAEAGKPEKAPVDLNAAVAKTVDLLSPKAKKKKLTLTFKGPSKLTVQANAAQLDQVLINLIDNGLNYTSAGSVEVEVSQNDQWAKIDVRDTGIGIASDHLPRVFERFYRVDKGRSRATGGTGLGLSIVKHIVESHGGSVTVESELNQGTTVTVKLPLS
jgi:two-component system phosphate regulon sensor histidine kinase PhoR